MFVLKEVLCDPAEIHWQAIDFQISRAELETEGGAWLLDGVVDDLSTAWITESLPDIRKTFRFR